MTTPNTPDTTQKDATTRFNIAFLKLEPLAALPTDLRDGDVCYVKTDDATGKLSFRIGGKTVSIAQDGTVTSA